MRHGYLPAGLLSATFLLALSILYARSGQQSLADPAASVHITDTQAREIVERLISTKRALYDAALEMQPWIAMIEDHPDMFLSIVAVELSDRLGSDVQRFDLATSNQCFRLLSILSLCGKDRAGPVVWNLLNQSMQRREALVDQADSSTGSSTEESRVAWETEQSLEYFTSSCFSSLTRLRDPCAADLALDCLEHRSYPSVPVLLDYLAMASTNAPRIRPRLDELYAARDSRLRGRPELLRTIRRIDMTPRQRTEADVRAIMERRFIPGCGTLSMEQHSSLKCELLDNADVLYQLATNDLRLILNCTGGDLDGGMIARCQNLARMIDTCRKGRDADLIYELFDVAIERLEELYDEYNPDRVQFPPPGPLYRWIHTYEEVPRSLLTLLEKNEDPYAADAAMRILPFPRNSALPYVSLRYLERIAHRRPDIRPRMVECLHSHLPGLGNSRDVRRVIDAIDRAAQPLPQRIHSYILYCGAQNYLGAWFEGRLVDDLRQHPEDLQQYVIPRIRPLYLYLQLSDGHRREYLAALRLYMLCEEAGRKLAADLLRQAIETGARPPPCPPKVSRSDAAWRAHYRRIALHQMQSSILRTMGELCDQRIFDDALVLVAQKKDDRIRFDAVWQYLEPLLANDLEVRKRVRHELSNPASPIYHDAQLRKLLCTIEFKY